MIPKQLLEDLRHRMTHHDWDENTQATLRVTARELEALLETALFASMVKDLLKHSWQSINFKYDLLTQSERQLVTRDEFERLVTWITR